MENASILALLLMFLILVSGCVQTQSNEENATSLCQKICNSKLSENISNGPCLSDSNANWTVNDWVCDVAHSPRQSVDDLPENQCSAYRSGEAHHFDEVDTNCNLIKSV